MLLENTLSNNKSTIKAMRDRLSQNEGIKLDKSSINIKLSDCQEENFELKTEIR